MRQGPLPVRDAELPTRGDDEPLTPEEEAAVREWWVKLPDFIMPSYPFDVPPDRMLGARTVFNYFGVPRTCPVGACRRTGECQGGDGPPCYRERPKELRGFLFEGWINIYYPELLDEGWLEEWLNAYYPGLLDEAEDDADAVVHDTGGGRPPCPAAPPSLTPRAPTKRKRRRSRRRQ